MYVPWLKVRVSKASRDWFRACSKTPQLPCISRIVRRIHFKGESQTSRNDLTEFERRRKSSIESNIDSQTKVHKARLGGEGEDVGNCYHWEVNFQNQILELNSDRASFVNERAKTTSCLATGTSP